MLLYSVGRGVIETLRIDDANRFFGVRLNVFTSILIAVGALVYLVVSARLRPGREDPATLGAARQGAAPTTDESDDPEATPSDAAARRARRCGARCRCSRGRTIAVGRLGTRRAVGARCG